MKRFCVLLMAVLTAAVSCLSVTAFAASDFEIQDGVLVSYNGSDEDVTVPEGVFAIGASAFKGNTALRCVTLPSSVYEIGDMAFDGCTALKTVIGGDNVTETGVFAFRGSPYLNDSATKYFMLGHVLLWYNGTASSVSIPTSCVSVAPYAFARCDYLTSFNAYEGLLQIGDGAFYGCSSLSEVSLPSTVSEIGAYAFDGAPVLDSLGDFAVMGDGVLVKYRGTETEVTVPENVRRVAPFAFTGAKLRSVTLPASVYSIDAYAFADCVGLEEITLENGLVMIGDGAFRGCKSLSALKTPETLSYIGQGAFRGDAALDHAALRGDALSVSYNAFQGCTGLRYVLASEGVAALYDGAFDGCTALEGFAVSSGVSDVSAAALSGCGKVTVCCDDGAPARSALASHTVCTVMGDVDENGELSIIDATQIQRFIVYLQSFSGSQTAVSDFNFDGEINTLDALCVQLRLAQVA